MLTSVAPGSAAASAAATGTGSAAAEELTRRRLLRSYRPAVPALTSSIAIEGTRKAVPIPNFSTVMPNRSASKRGRLSVVGAAVSAPSSITWPALVPIGKACRACRECA